MGPAIVLDPDGGAENEFLMRHEESTAWLRIGDDIVLRLYRPRRRAEQEDGTVHSELPLLGIEIFETNEQVNEGTPSAVFAFGGEHGMPALREQSRRPRNIRVEYLCCETSGGRRWGEAVFANPESWSTEMVWRKLNSVSQPIHFLSDAMHFQPDVISVGGLRFTNASYGEDEDGLEDNLQLQDFQRVTDTGEQATDDRTIDEFIQAIRRMHGAE